MWYYKYRFLYERGKLNGNKSKIDKTVDWLREKVKEAGCKGLVVGFLVE